MYTFDSIADKGFTMMYKPKMQAIMLFNRIAADPQNKTKRPQICEDRHIPRRQFPPPAHLSNPFSWKCYEEFVCASLSFSLVIRMIYISTSMTHLGYQLPELAHLQSAFALMISIWSLRNIHRDLGEEKEDLFAVRVEKAIYRPPKIPFIPQSLFGFPLYVSGHDLSVILSKRHLSRAPWIGDMRQDSGLLVSGYQSLVSVVHGRMSASESAFVLIVNLLVAVLVKICIYRPSFKIYPERGLTILPWVSIFLSISVWGVYAYFWRRRDEWVFVGRHRNSTGSSGDFRELITGRRVVDVADCDHLRLTRRETMSQLSIPMVLEQKFSSGKKQYGLLLGMEMENTFTLGRLTAREALHVVIQIEKRFAALFDMKDIIT